MKNFLKNKKLYRNEEDSPAAGVCEGLGEYFEIDPTFIRLIAVFGALLGACTVLIYIVLWIVVPEKPEENESTRKMSSL